MTMMNVATTQMACTWDLKHNLDQAERLMREAAVQIDSGHRYSQADMRARMRAWTKFKTAIAK